eukprot:12920894-Heterocapsa_arctica.AAC.1
MGLHTNLRSKSLPGARQCIGIRTGVLSGAEQSPDRTRGSSARRAGTGRRRERRMPIQGQKGAT